MQTDCAKRSDTASTAGGSGPEAVATIKELMVGIVDPASDVVFESVSTTVTTAGITEKRPSTDEEWATVEHNALMMAEAMNLITAPSRVVAHPNEMDKAPSEPDAPELTPKQIQERIDADRPLFGRYAASLQAAALQARDVARAKNVQALLDVGEKIDTACENCHLYYWYPKPGEIPPAP